RLAPLTAGVLDASTNTATSNLGASPRAAEPTLRSDAALWLADGWNVPQPWADLPGRGTGLLVALAADAGHSGGPIIVAPAPPLAVIAAYVGRDADDAPPRLLVNPVVLAALEPVAGEADAVAALDRGSLDPTAGPRGGATTPLAGATTVASTGGNPYS